MNPKYNPVMAPKLHQIASVNTMLATDLANFDDQGLGKCKQAYDLAGNLFEKGEIDLMIMVSKAALRDNFHREVSKDAIQLISKVVTGTRAERKRIYAFPSYHVLVISYETVISDNAELCKLIAKHRTLLCLDEAHYIKNPDAKRTQACLELAKVAKRKQIFTGTPVPNDPTDIYTQLTFLGHDVGDSVESFRERFGDIQAFRDFLKANMIRRKKENVIELNLPKKSTRQVCVKLSREERQVYEKAAKDFLVQFTSKNMEKTEIPIQGVLAQLTRLTQITSNPNLLIPNFDGPVSKIEKLEKMVRKLSARGEKVIVWTSYRENVRMLLERFSDIGAVSLVGGLTKSEIESVVSRFQNDGNTKVLIAIPACAREGFTLTAASTAIYLDRNFALLDWVQSQDRIHRIGQTKPCEIIVLVGENTIDERIDHVLEKKDHIQKFLLGDLEEYSAEESLTPEQLKKIVGI
jgi:SWI/SNF-related matrix-associated actin-dependent regulator of chromatin subfamily A-like protein 1